MYVNQALSPVLVALRKHRSLMPQRRRITIRRQSGGGHLHLPRSCRRGPRSRHDLLIPSHPCGHPDPFRSVRYLGFAAARCSHRSGELHGRSSVWLPAWLPSAGHHHALVLVTTIGPLPGDVTAPCLAQAPPPNPAAAEPDGRRVLSRGGAADHEVTPQAPLTGSGCREHSYGGFGGGHPHFLLHVPDLLIRRLRHIAQGRPLRSVRWADIPGLPISGRCCPPSWQQYWQQSHRTALGRLPPRQSRPTSYGPPGRPHRWTRSPSTGRVADLCRESRRLSRRAHARRHQGAMGQSRPPPIRSWRPASAKRPLIQDAVTKLETRVCALGSYVLTARTSRGHPGTCTSLQEGTSHGYTLPV